MTRTKGSKNRKTEQWEEFAEWFILTGVPRLREEMEKLDGEKYIQTMKDLMEYFQPKLARTENHLKVEELPAPIMDILNSCPTSKPQQPKK